MKPMISALALSLAALAGPALADDHIEEIEAQGSVSEVADRLVAAVEGAGATVFARVDHAGGAASVQMELAPMELVIFGNPQLGTPAMQDDVRAGLVLPLRVLVYDDNGRTTILYEEADDLFDDLAIDDDAAYVGQMAEALRMLTAAAAGE